MRYAVRLLASASTISVTVCAFAAPSAVGFIPKRDPFARPANAATQPAAQTAPPIAPAAAPSVSEWRPALRGVMLGAGAPLVDIDSRILTVGDSIDGYRLTAVREREAVFMRDGRKIILHLDTRKAP